MNTLAPLLMTTDTQIGITDEELSSINFALISRYGMDFSDYEPLSLKRRISRILHKNQMNSIFDLWQKLLYDPIFAVHFKDEISVGLTEMFRNPTIWVHLKEEYLEKFNNSSKISIWHAGCSTGEEYYTMAIVLKETKNLAKAEVTVTDLSDKFIEITQNGSYDLELLAKYQINYQLYNKIGKFQLYYEKTNEKGIMLSNLRPKTNFIQHNLVTDKMDLKYDIIFCRNVMIYFNDTLKMKVLKQFYNCLNDNGLLIIGHFDAMPSNYNDYFEYYDPSLKFFTKK